MDNENLGCKVVITKTDGSSFTIHNVTEIHYNYGNKKDKRIMLALESDVHGTGMTLFMDEIVEFETRLETERARWF